MPPTPETPPTPLETFLSDPTEVHCAGYGLVLGYAVAGPHERVGGATIATLLRTTRVQRELSEQPHYAAGAFLIGVALGVAHQHHHQTTDA